MQHTCGQIQATFFTVFSTFATVLSFFKNTHGIIWFDWNFGIPDNHVAPMHRPL